MSEDVTPLKEILPTENKSQKSDLAGDTGRGPANKGVLLN